MTVYKWIKIVVDIFDDEKIKLIDSMPDADAIEVIWFKLLTLAGKCCNNGVYVLNGKIPFTDEMFASIFNRPLATVRLALNVFVDLEMIEIVDDIYTVPNWDKYQSGDRLEIVKEQNRKRQERYREKRRKLITSENNVTDNVTDNATNNVNCSYSYSISNNNYIDSNNTNISINDNDNENERIVPRIVDTSEKKPDLEVWYEYIYKNYPKKSNYVSGQKAFCDFFKDIPSDEWTNIADDISEALKLYKKDYEKNYKDDKTYKYMQSIDKWLKDSAIGWIKEVEKNREKEKENVFI